MDKKLSLNAGHLKSIAAVSMTIDHLAVALLYVVPVMSRPLFGASSDSVSAASQLLAGLTLYSLMRGAGRLAFPIFAFFIVEGYCYTRNIRRYLLRLLIVALLAEVPFNYLFHGSAVYPGYQDTIWTLLIGLAALIATDAAKKRWPKYAQWIPVAVGLLFGGITYLIKTDYPVFGVLLICVYYHLRENRRKQLFAGAVMSLWEWPAVFAFPLLNLYDGTRGKSMKWFFFVFYPAHLALLVILRRLILAGIF